MSHNNSTIVLDDSSVLSSTKNSSGLLDEDKNVSVVEILSSSEDEEENYVSLVEDNHELAEGVEEGLGDAYVVNEEDEIPKQTEANDSSVLIVDEIPIRPDVGTAVTSEEPLSIVEVHPSSPYLRLADEDKDYCTPGQEEKVDPTKQVLASVIHD